MTTDIELAGYLRRILPDGNLEEVLAPAPGLFEAADAGIAAGAVRKLLEGRDLDATERFTIEAIIIPDIRPAIDIVDDGYVVDHRLWTDLNHAPAKDRLLAAIPSIGRIELPGHPQIPYGGTGFVVGRGLVMTNRHVAETFATGVGTRQLAFIPGRRAGIDFRRENGRDDTSYLTVDRVVMIHPYWDMALLAVDGLPEERPPLRLSLRDGGLVGRKVAVIGYPAFDSRNPAEVQHEVFRGVYEVKRLQPGLMGKRARIASYGESLVALSHDSSTLGGNSGSAVVDVETGEVLGLHFAGSYLKANYAVPVFELGRDGRVIDAGVTFEGSPTRRANAWDVRWTASESAPSRATGRDDAAGGPARPSAQTVADATPHVGQATFRLPFEITVSIALADGVLSAAPAPVAEERVVEVAHDPDYANRNGYDPGFLGVEAPMPTVTVAGDAAPTETGDPVLEYCHFSIVMHARRRLAILTAANVDASTARKSPGGLPSSSYTRDGLGGLGRNDREKWFADPRIDARYQLSDSFYNEDRGSFDKGHLVRREDVAWGDTYQEMKKANGDTFHITNCSPQVAEFNRAGRGASPNWGDLERVVLSQAGTERLCVFAGPVLDGSDPTFLGKNGATSLRLQVPSRYWKVIVAASAGGLSSYGFILEQDLAAVDTELVLPTVWIERMVPIRDIGQAAGVTFADAILGSDRSGSPEASAFRK